MTSIHVHFVQSYAVLKLYHDIHVHMYMYNVHLHVHVTCVINMIKVQAQSLSPEVHL